MTLIATLGGLETMNQQGNPKTAVLSGKKTETMEDKNQEPYHRAEHVAGEERAGQRGLSYGSS